MTQEQMTVRDLFASSQDTMDYIGKQIHMFSADSEMERESKEQRGSYIQRINESLFEKLMSGFDEKIENK